MDRKWCRNEKISRRGPDREECVGFLLFYRSWMMNESEWDDMTTTTKAAVVFFKGQEMDCNVAIKIKSITRR